MLVYIRGPSCYIYRQGNDKPFLSSAGGWGDADSRLLYVVKCILQNRGYPIIKKRMHKDGHLMGTDSTQYLRTRNSANLSFCIYHGDWQIELAAENFNVLGRVVLDVQYGLDDESASKGWVAEQEKVHVPLLFEVSWDDTVTLDGDQDLQRVYRGFANKTEAMLCREWAKYVGKPMIEICDMILYQPLRLEEVVV